MQSAGCHRYQQMSKDEKVLCSGTVAVGATPQCTLHHIIASLGTLVETYIIRHQFPPYDMLPRRVSLVSLF